ncbi:Hypothetical protein POVN_LOCUS409 [uncultured virus]|nr:Hypothetical protein POVN_LOCUS409 [uncultured virus]
MTEASSKLAQTVTTYFNNHARIKDHHALYGRWQTLGHRDVVVDLLNRDNGVTDVKDRLGTYDTNRWHFGWYLAGRGYNEQFMATFTIDDYKKEYAKFEATMKASPYAAFITGLFNEEPVADAVKGRYAEAKRLSSSLDQVDKRFFEQRGILTNPEVLGHFAGGAGYAMDTIYPASEPNLATLLQMDKAAQRLKLGSTTPFNNGTLTRSLADPWNEAFVRGLMYEPQKEPVVPIKDEAPAEITVLIDLGKNVSSLVTTKNPQNADQLAQWILKGGLFTLQADLLKFLGGQSGKTYDVPVNRAYLKQLASNFDNMRKAIDDNPASEDMTGGDDRTDDISGYIAGLGYTPEQVGRFTASDFENIATAYEKEEGGGRGKCEAFIAGLGSTQF